MLTISTNMASPGAARLLIKGDRAGLLALIEQIVLSLQDKPTDNIPAKLWNDREAIVWVMRVVED